jgi:hypothetical protein
MYQRSFPVSDHPPIRIGSATGARVGEHARVRQCTAAKKEGGSLIRGTEESDRAAALAPAEIEVRAEAVFLAAVAQNIKRLARFLSQPTTPTVEAPLS